MQVGGYRPQFRQHRRMHSQGHHSERLRPFTRPGCGDPLSALKPWNASSDAAWCWGVPGHRAVFDRLSCYTPHFPAPSWFYSPHAEFCFPAASVERPVAGFKLRSTLILGHEAPWPISFAAEATFSVYRFGATSTKQIALRCSLDMPKGARSSGS